MRIKAFIASFISIFVFTFGGFMAGNIASDRPIPATLRSVVTAVSAQNEPIKLLIPQMGVDAGFEYVGETPDGRMDVPKDEDNVAWWKYGAGPGGNGSMVVAGHVDRREGGPGVFYNIQYLKVGDLIEVTDQKGRIHQYVVLDTHVYSDDNFPLEAVFGRRDNKYLNLVTCTGFYDRSTKNYVDRLVVYTKYVSTVRS